MTLLRPIGANARNDARAAEHVQAGGLVGKAGDQLVCTQVQVGSALVA